MDHREAGAYWEKNAGTWTRLVRRGYDVYRDLVNTPGFLRMLPDVAGLRGLDVGCGEGHNTRLIEKRGARMTGVDVAPTFVRAAKEMEAERGGRIGYVVGSGVELPFAAGNFDFATALMSLMDLPEQDRALEEIHRVLRPGGFLQFSITHPCFSTPHRRLLRNAEGEAYAVEVGRYFERENGRLERWIFGAAPAKERDGLDLFEVPIFHRTLSEWMNSVAGAGFSIEEVGEPRADDETALGQPRVQDTQVVGYFLHVRGRKR